MTCPIDAGSLSGYKPESPNTRDWFRCATCGAVWHKKQLKEKQA